LSGDEVLYVFVEIDDDGALTRLSREVAGLGYEVGGMLGHPLSAVVIGADTSKAEEALLEMGAATVFAAGDERLARYDPESYLAILAELTAGGATGIIIAGHTHVTQDLMPRVAAVTGAGLVMDCVGLSVEDGAVLFEKPVFGGNAVASLEITTPLKIVTLRPRVGTPGQAPAPFGKSVALGVPDIERNIVPGEEFHERRELGLDDAPVVVAGGRGMGGAEGFDELRELAAMLGAAVGASRPPCDSGWISPTCQVGITGKMVAPDLYFAVGLSGSSQHLSGMSESGKIVAINSDPDAYIFKVSDYGAVGDWRKVLPAFAGAVRRLEDG